MLVHSSAVYRSRLQKGLLLQASPSVYSHTHLGYKQQNIVLWSTDSAV